MEKKIPLYFDSVTVSSPIEQISKSNPNLGRLKVRVFTKYANRNMSYITDAVADQLIQSATNGSTPVIGFFDPESQSWSSHTGPKLANGYGYVENFLGWEPFTDTDGITREYAVFSVILFTDYFEEARKILGENQSMELDPLSIEGDWANINGQEYFVFTKAKTLGLCVIGQHEPCFSVSAFFSKNDELYTSQYEKFSSLLSDLKAQVEEAEKTLEGGEQPMDEFNNTEIVEEVTSQEAELQENTEEVTDTFQEVEEQVAEENHDEEESAAEPEPEQESEAGENSEFEALQLQLQQLQDSFNELQSNYDAAIAQIETLTSQNETINQEFEHLREENATLQTTVEAYEQQNAALESSRKNNLLDEYTSLLDNAEIEDIRTNINDFSYEELESRLAVSFAKKEIEKKKNPGRVPLIEPESPFALLMKNYKK